MVPLQSHLGNTDPVVPCVDIRSTGHCEVPLVRGCRHSALAKPESMERHRIDSLLSGGCSVHQGRCRRVQAVAQCTETVIGMSQNANLNPENQSICSKCKKFMQPDWKVCRCDTRHFLLCVTVTLQWQSLGNVCDLMPGVCTGGSMHLAVKQCAMPRTSMRETHRGDGWTAEE